MGLAGGRRAAILLTVVVAFSVVAAAPAQAAPGYCADTMLIGVRGTHQPDGYGAEVRAVVDEVRAMNRSEKRLRTEALDYSALLSVYFPSKDQGYDRLYQKLRSWGTSCPRARFALVGYSQGAHIVGDMLNTIVRTGGPVPRSRLVGAVLMGDPSFNAGSPGSQRIGGGWGAPISGRRAAYPATLNVRSVCLAGDAVCDHYGPFGGFQGANDVFFKGPHMRYNIEKWPKSRSTVARHLGQSLGNNVSLVPRRH